MVVGVVVVVFGVGVVLRGLWDRTAFFFEALCAGHRHSDLTNGPKVD